MRSISTLFQGPDGIVKAGGGGGRWRQNQRVAALILATLRLLKDLTCGTMSGYQAILLNQ
jgi:hypothetical protein